MPLGSTISGTSKAGSTAAAAASSGAKAGPSAGSKGAEGGKGGSAGTNAGSKASGAKAGGAATGAKSGNVGSGAKASAGAQAAAAAGKAAAASKGAPSAGKSTGGGKQAGASAAAGRAAASGRGMSAPSAGKAAGASAADARAAASGRGTKAPASPAQARAAASGRGTQAPSSLAQAVAAASGRGMKSPALGRKSGPGGAGGVRTTDFGYAKANETKAPGTPGGPRGTRPSVTSQLTMGVKPNAVRTNFKDAVNNLRTTAKNKGLDPDTVEAVARKEGLRPGAYISDIAHRDPEKAKLGAREPSYGPMQALKGGLGTGYNQGVGNRFAKATGLDPADPKNMSALNDFALDVAAKEGWGQWSGATALGLNKTNAKGKVTQSGRQGLPSKAEARNLPSAEQKAAGSFPAPSAKPTTVAQPKAAPAPAIKTAKPSGPFKSPTSSALNPFSKSNIRSLPAIAKAQAAATKLSARPAMQARSANAATGPSRYGGAIQGPQRPAAQPSSANAAIGSRDLGSMQGPQRPGSQGPQRPGDAQYGGRPTQGPQRPSAQPKSANAATGSSRYGEKTRAPAMKATEDKAAQGRRGLQKGTTRPSPLAKSPGYDPLSSVRTRAPTKQGPRQPGYDPLSSVRTRAPTMQGPPRRTPSRPAAEVQTRAPERAPPTRTIPDVQTRAPTPAPPTRTVPEVLTRSPVPAPAYNPLSSVRAPRMLGYDPLSSVRTRAPAMQGPLRSTRTVPESLTRAPEPARAPKQITDRVPEEAPSKKQITDRVPQEDMPAKTRTVPEVLTRPPEKLEDLVAQPKTKTKAGVKTKTAAKTKAGVKQGVPPKGMPKALVVGLTQKEIDEGWRVRQFTVGKAPGQRKGDRYNVQSEEGASWTMRAAGLIPGIGTPLSIGGRIIGGIKDAMIGSPYGYQGYPTARGMDHPEAYAGGGQGWANQRGEATVAARNRRPVQEQIIPPDMPEQGEDIDPAFLAFLSYIQQGQPTQSAAEGGEIMPQDFPNRPDNANPQARFNRPAAQWPSQQARQQGGGGGPPAWAPAVGYRRNLVAGQLPAQVTPPAPVTPPAAPPAAPPARAGGPPAWAPAVGYRRNLAAAAPPAPVTPPVLRPMPNANPQARFNRPMPPPINNATRVPGPKFNRPVPGFADGGLISRLGGGSRDRNRDDDNNDDNKSSSKTPAPYQLKPRSTVLPIRGPVPYPSDYSRVAPQQQAMFRARWDALHPPGAAAPPTGTQQPPGNMQSWLSNLYSKYPGLQQDLSQYNWGNMGGRGDRDRDRNGGGGRTLDFGRFGKFQVGGNRDRGDDHDRNRNPDRWWDGGGGGGYGMGIGGGRLFHGAGGGPYQDWWTSAGRDAFRSSAISPEWQTRLTDRWGKIGAGAAMPTTWGGFFDANRAYRTAQRNPTPPPGTQQLKRGGPVVKKSKFAKNFTKQAREERKMKAHMAERMSGNYAEGGAVQRFIDRYPEFRPSGA